MKSAPGPSTIAFGANDTTISPADAERDHVEAPHRSAAPVRWSLDDAGHLRRPESGAGTRCEGDHAGHEAIRRESAFRGHGVIRPRRAVGPVVETRVRHGPIEKRAAVACADGRGRPVERRVAGRVARRVARWRPFRGRAARGAERTEDHAAQSQRAESATASAIEERRRKRGLIANLPAFVRKRAHLDIVLSN